MEWLRLYTELLDDPKIAKLSEKSFKIFIFLLCFAQELNENGVINRSLSDIAWRLRLPEAAIKKAIKDLIELDILSLDECILFRKWSERQYKSDNSTSRVKKHRAKDETLHETFQGTLQETPKTGKRNVIEQNRTDTEQSRADAGNVSQTEKPVDNDLKKTASLEKQKTTPDEKPGPDEKPSQFLLDLRETLKKLKEIYPRYDNYHACEEFVTQNARRKNPDAIIHCLNSLIKNHVNVKIIRPYLNAALKIEDGKYNARESEKRSDEFKTAPDIAAFMKAFGCAIKSIPEANAIG